jgi:hypothetical protein
MPIDTIGSLNLQIGEQKAKGLEQEDAAQAQREQTLARGIGGATQAAVSGVESALAGEVEIQKKREADELLKSGAEGIGQYATEMGLDPTVYVNMAGNVKDKTKFVEIYKLIKMKADKQASEAKRMEVLGGAVSSIQELRANPKATREDYEKLVANMGIQELNADKDTALQINRTKDDLMKEANRKFGDPAKKSLKASQAATKQRQKDETAVEKAMRTTILGGRGGQKVFGNAINKVSGIMDGLDTVKGIEEGEFKATKQIGAELGSIIAQVLAPGGSSTAEDRRSLAPESFAADAKGVIQYVTGNPQEAIDSGLLEQLQHMLERERKFWNDRLKKSNAQMYFTVKPALERKGGDGRFVNADLARNWGDLMDTLGERGEFDTPATDRAQVDQTGVSKVVEQNIPAEEDFSQLSDEELDAMIAAEQGK